MSESVPRGNRPANEAANELRTLWRTMPGKPVADRLLDAALRAERLAVVEEIRSRMGPSDFLRSDDWAFIARVLDEVGVAGHTEERTDG